MFEYLEIDIDEKRGINRIVLDRPDRRNALNLGLVAELKEAFALAGADDRIGVIGIGGNGPDFCAGADLSEIQAAVEEGVMTSLGDAESLGELFLLMRRLDKPIVALVHGRALAGGCGLATACDLVLATESASFGYPEIKLGFVPAMVMAILKRNLGEKRAFELIAMGDSLSAKEAAAWGLVNRVFPDAGFEAGADDFLARLASRSATGLALSKRLLSTTDNMGFEGAIAAGAQVNALARLTDDCQAGIRRFLDRE
jgi:methylglutaconyl-CoA hydratase